MYSFDFPSMLNSSTARLRTDKEAVRSNVLLLLQTEKNSLFGDPYFGVELKQYLFEQAASIVPDLLIDKLLSAIIEFVPQVYITRDDITVSTDGTDIFATIKYMYILDNTVDIYTINLTENDKE